jgi:hypothetical protein
MHYHKIEKMIDSIVKFKEAKILNEIQTFGKEKKKKKDLQSNFFHSPRTRTTK